MGCGASTPVKDDPPKKPEKKGTSAASHANLRSKEGSQRGPSLYVGPDYKKLKHLGMVCHLHELRWELVPVHRFCTWSR